MSATIYTFPSKKGEEPEQPAYKISLYSDMEIETVLSCVNIFSNLDYKADYDNITKLDPALVLQCVLAAKSSWIFSDDYKIILDIILENVKEI